MIALMKNKFGNVEIEKYADTTSTHVAHCRTHWQLRFLMKKECANLLSHWSVQTYPSKYCNVDGQSGVFTVPCRAVPCRAVPCRAGQRRARCYTELR
jgi:hypothetical protein